MLVIFTERPLHFFLSHHAQFLLMTFMEMRERIRSPCLLSRTERVTYCFMVKSLERKLPCVNPCGPSIVMPTSWLPEEAMPLHQSVAHQWPFAVFWLFIYNFVKLRLKLLAAICAAYEDIYNLCCLWGHLYVCGYLFNFESLSVFAKSMAFVFILGNTGIFTVSVPYWNMLGHPSLPLQWAQSLVAPSSQRVCNILLLYWLDFGFASPEPELRLGVSPWKQGIFLGSSLLPRLCPPSRWDLSQQTSWLLMQKHQPCPVIGMGTA